MTGWLTCDERAGEAWYISWSSCWSRLVYCSDRLVLILFLYFFCKTQVFASCQCFQVLPASVPTQIENPNLWVASQWIEPISLVVLAVKHKSSLRSWKNKSVYRKAFEVWGNKTVLCTIKIRAAVYTSAVWVIVCEPHVFILPHLSCFSLFPGSWMKDEDMLSSIGWWFLELSDSHNLAVQIGPSGCCV